MKMLRINLALLMLLVCFGQILSLVAGSIIFIILRDLLFVILGVLLVCRVPITDNLKIVSVSGIFIIPLIVIEGVGDGQAHLQQMYLASRNVLTPWFVAILCCALAAASSDKRPPKGNSEPILGERILQIGLIYIVLEFLVIRFAPDVYGLYNAAVSLFLESKGVEANAAAGLLADYRARTSLMNPVQGCWLYLLYFLFYRTRGNWPLIASFAIALVTVTKVAIVALGAYVLFRARALRFILPVLLVGTLLAPLLTIDPADLEEHMNSALFRVRGLRTAYEQLLIEPFGVGLLKSGVIGSGVQGHNVPGMESGFGVILSAFGLAGMAYLLVLFFVISTRGRVYFAFSVVFLVGIVSSENIMVPYLYAPLLLVLEERTRSLSQTGYKMPKQFSVSGMA